MKHLWYDGLIRLLNKWPGWVYLLGVAVVAVAWGVYLRR